ncbi:hypothetical protein NUM3379_16320 [Kineococcus sp. NUM-3379]
MRLRLSSPTPRRSHGARGSPAWRDLVLVAVLLALDLILFHEPHAEGVVVRGRLLPLLVAALALTCTVPLLAGRRHPLPVFVLVWAASSAALALTTGYRPTMGLWGALYLLAARSGWRVLAAACAAMVLPGSLLVWREVGAAVPHERADTLVVTAVLLLVVTAGIVATGRYRGSSTRALRDLERRRQEEAARAVAAERARIARELHDIVAHAVSLMALQATGASRVVRSDPERAERALAQVGELGRQAVSELHRMLGLLHGTGAEPAPVQEPGPGLDGLGALFARVRQSGVELEVSVHGTPRSLDPSGELAAYRVLQESLTNALRYGDPREPVHVQLTWQEHDLLVGVRNRVAPAGRVATGSTGHGLLGLAERVRAVGGRFQAGAEDGGAFAVTSTLPLSEAPGPPATVPARPQADRARR